MVTIKKEKRQINVRVFAIYELVYDGESYAISCMEQSKWGECLDFCRVPDFTRDEKCANSIYETIVKNGVCACTLFDIVNDLICWN